MSSQACCIETHVNIQVFVGRPMDQIFYLVIPDIGQRRNSSRDSGSTKSIWIQLSQTKLNLCICSDGLKCRNNFRSICIQFAELGIQLNQSIVNLGIGNILGTIVVDDMENHRNHI